MPDRAARALLSGSVILHTGGAAATLAGLLPWEGLAAGLAANHAILCGASVAPRCGWLGPNLTRLPDTAPGGVLSLTFDDGPDPDVTPTVLELLRQADARATFFCIGRRAERHPDVVEAIRAAGHGIENHTYRHPNALALRSKGVISREIARAQNAINDAGGGIPTLFRPPAGMKNPWMGAAITEERLRLVTWTRRGFDTVSRSGARVAQRLMRGLAARDILVLHDRGSARDASGLPVMLEALSRVLDGMSTKNLRSEPVHVVLQS